MSRFLDAHDIEVRETVPASRKIGKTEAASLARASSEIFVAKGRKLDQLKGGTASGSVVDRLLGPTGNLRSPTLRVGKILIVGFDEETLKRVLL